MADCRFLQDQIAATNGMALTIRTVIVAGDYDAGDWADTLHPEAACYARLGQLIAAHYIQALINSGVRLAA